MAGLNHAWTLSLSLNQLKQQKWRKRRIQNMCSGVEFLLRSWVQDSHGECVAHHKKSVLGGGGGSSIKYSQLINSALTFLSLLISWSSLIVLYFGLLWLFLGINCWLAGCYNYWRTKSCFIQLSVWLHLLFSIRLMPPRNLLQTLL